MRGPTVPHYQRFVANALWSKDRLHHAKKVHSPQCLRCGNDVESVNHLLWDCSANNMAFDRLRRAWVSLKPNPVTHFSLPNEIPLASVLVV